jgi:DNA-binding HxlR family transcriptional regulator
LARALAATGDHWTLAIALELAPGRMRLGQLQRRLPGVSSGVLDRHLAQMVAFGLIARERFREMPPRVEIELTESGRGLLPIATALAHWGMRFRWSEPDATELVDINVLLRMLPALLELIPDRPVGSLEAILYEPERGSVRLARHVICADGDQRGRVHQAPAEGSELAVGHAAARVGGTREAWIAALGPARDLAQLQITGDVALAARQFAALPRAS